jgi:hypothetical protein
MRLAAAVLPDGLIARCKYTPETDPQKERRRLAGGRVTNGISAVHATPSPVDFEHFGFSELFTSIKKEVSQCSIISVLIWAARL